VGSLAVPSSGHVYVDSQICIYTVERHAKYAPVLQALWMAARAGQVTVVTSELSTLESLVLPLRRHNDPLTQDYDQFFQLPTIRTNAISSSILREAAKLRALHRSLKTPDAIHAATAFHVGASLFLSNDYGFRAIPGLPLVLLDDILASP
jgi:predicted nucleic acid-binding protein